ncbi:cytochrome P450 [Nocardioides zeae]|nr:cytochrome P450 [Nocardioides zeae]MDR6174220.1 cytochrome P450 [Nocardioides zeae]
MRDAAGRAAAELLVSLAGAEDVDLVRDFASPFVCYFWAEQLGMPVEVADQLPEVMDAMNAMFLFDPGAEDVARLRAATARYVDLVSESIDASDVATPVLDHLRAHLSTTEGLRDPVTVGRFVASNYFDGFHTAGVAVASTLRQLLDSPTSLRLVRDDPGLAGAAFQESTRLATPVMVSTRLTLAEVELGGLRIPPQTPLAMVWAAGNRDPDVFADPHVFDLHRGAGLASTFGGGAHLCPGRNIARVLAEAAVTAFVDPSLEVVPRGRSGGWIPGSAMRVLTTLPVSVRVRDA